MGELSNLYVASMVAPHEDELFVSLCNRVWRRTGEPSSNRFSMRVNQDSNSSYFLFRRAPQGLRALADALGIDPLALIHRHTLIPYWESVSPIPLNAQQYLNLLKSDHVNARYRLNSWQRQKMQFCIKCVQEDTEKLGEPIWRRCHQLPGVTVCVKHNCWLTRTCDSCGWTTSVRFLTYPPLACPNGHKLVPQQREQTLGLKGEAAFAQWSLDLLDYRLGERTGQLLATLRNFAATRGLRPWRRGEWSGDAADELLRRHEHPLLKDSHRLVSRVSNAPYHHVMDPALRSAPAGRPHPVAVLFCVKAIAGPNCDVLATLKEAEPRVTIPRPNDWRGQWESLPTNATQQRREFLTRFFADRAPRAKAGTVGQLEEALGKELGLGGGSMHRYRVLFPELSQGLRRLRPEIWQYNGVPAAESRRR